MIEIFDPSTIVVEHAAEKYAQGWHYPLDYTWVLSVLREMSIPDTDLVLDVGSGTSKFPDHIRSLGYDVTTMDRGDWGGKHDIDGGFLPYDFKDRKFDVIMWLSSIEHQPDIADIAACYQKSMDLLNYGGLFIATFPIAPITEWVSVAKHWNLSKEAAMRFFRSPTVKGNYEKIWEEYRKNTYNLRDRYVARFDHWDTGDPAYLAAGVVKAKAD